MCEGRNRTGKSKLGTDEISLQMSVGALERSRRISEVRFERQRSQDFERPTHVPTVEVEILGSKRGGATGDDAGALRSLREGDRRAYEGVAAKKFDTLTIGGHCEKECNENESAQ